jgi:hypothetical protein
MSEAELTPEEKNHLYTQCGISFLVVTFSFLAWLLFFERSKLPLNEWAIFIYVGLPYCIIGPTSFFLPYEALYPLRVRKSRIFHLKRFFRRTLSLAAMILSFSAVTSISDVSFSRTLGDEAIYPGMLLFVLVFIVAALLWMKRQNNEGTRL